MKKSFMRLCLVFGGALVLSLPLYAAFEQGYVVTSGGDTLRGEIDMGSPHAMAHHCRFRSAETGKVTRFRPQNLKSFATNDLSRRFVSDSVPYFLKDRLLFLEVLQTGRLNLYYTYDLVLNNLFYVSKRNSKLIDVLFDWDKRKLIALKANYVALLKKAMVDAPELMLEIEHLKSPTPYALSDVVGRYNRRFDNSAKTAVENKVPPVAKLDKRLGLSVSPGMIIPDILYIDDIYIDSYCGLSLTKGPTDKRNGFYLSIGAYKPSFSVTTKFGDLRTLPALYKKDYDYVTLVPVRAAYRFSENKLQPMVGIDFQTYLNNVDTRFLLGPSFGLYYSPIKWVTLSCSVQYVFSEFYAKIVRYQTASMFNLMTELSINL